MNIGNLFRKILDGLLPLRAACVHHSSLEYDRSGVAHNPARNKRRKAIKAAGGIRQFKKQRRQ